MAKEVKVEKAKFDSALRKILGGKAMKSSDVKPQGKKPPKVIRRPE